MTVYDRIKALCDERGVSIYKVEKTLGFGNGSIKKWQTMRPYAERLAKVADYFGVTTGYLLGDTEDDPTEYYTDPEVSIITQQLKDRPELKILFDASKNLKKEDIEFVLDMIERMK